jgi:hypothetical protein
MGNRVRIIAFKTILVYPMSGDFIPYPYLWGQFLSYTCILIGEFSTDYRVSGLH